MIGDTANAHTFLEALTFIADHPGSSHQGDRAARVSGAALGIALRSRSRSGSSSAMPTAARSSRSACRSWSVRSEPLPDRVFLTVLGIGFATT